MAESIHFEAARMQAVCDRRTAHGVQRKPPYQPSYSTKTLPKDDAYSRVVKREGDVTVVQYFIKNDEKKPLDFFDEHAQSTSKTSRRRYNNFDYTSQW